MPEVIVVADFEVLSERLLGRLRRSATNLGMVGIGTGYVSNRSQKLYHWSQFVRKWKFYKLPANDI